LSAADGRIGDDRRREERIKDGRHVGLDIYDLLIEPISANIPVNLCGSQIAA
jgi:hypothetical protein